MLTSDQTSSIMAPSTRKNVNESSGSESPMKRRKTNRQTVEDYVAMPVESQQNNPRSFLSLPTPINRPISIENPTGGVTKSWTGTCPVYGYDRTYLEEFVYPAL